MRTLRAALQEERRFELGFEGQLRQMLLERVLQWVQSPGDAKDSEGGVSVSG